MSAVFFQLADPETFAGAPCTELDPDLGFPDHGERSESYAPKVQEAIDACAKCPIATRNACLQIAMNAEGMAPGESRYGVFGGLVPSERALLARQS